MIDEIARRGDVVLIYYSSWDARRGKWKEYARFTGPSFQMLGACQFLAAAVEANVQQDIAEQRAASEEDAEGSA